MRCALAARPRPTHGAYRWQWLGAPGLWEKEMGHSASARRRAWGIPWMHFESDNPVLAHWASVGLPLAAKKEENLGVIRLVLKSLLIPRQSKMFSNSRRHSWVDNGRTVLASGLRSPSVERKRNQKQHHEAHFPSSALYGLIRNPHYVDESTNSSRWCHAFLYLWYGTARVVSCRVVSLHNHKAG